MPLMPKAREQYLDDAYSYLQGGQISGGTISKEVR